MSEKQSSLTSPNDKSVENYIPNSKSSLNDEDAQRAFKECFISSLKDISYERRYADPRIPGQIYSLHSFIPSKDAIPDKDGIYGMIKIRGTFSSVEEANDKAEDLIRNHDSYHKIYSGWVGKPLPLTTKSDWSDKIEEIDIKQKISKIVREDIKEQRKKEKKEVQEIREREQNLKVAVEQEATDPYEKYTCLRVKKSQIIWGYLEHRKKLYEMLDIFEKTLLEIKDMDDEDEDYSKRYYERYLEAREKAGIPKDKNDVSFMKYLDTDIIDLEEYAKEQDKLEDTENYKSSRLAGSTITVTRREQPEDKEEDKEDDNEDVKEDEIEIPPSISLTRQETGEIYSDEKGGHKFIPYAKGLGTLIQDDVDSNEIEEIVEVGGEARVEVDEDDKTKQD